MASGWRLAYLAIRMYFGRGVRRARAGATLAQSRDTDQAKKREGEYWTKSQSDAFEPDMRHP